MMLLWVCLAGVATYFAIWMLVKRSNWLYGSYYHNKASHLVVIADNTEQQLEWWIRSYYTNRRISGSHGKVSCLLIGHTEEADRLLEKLNRRYVELEFIHMTSDDGAVERWMKANQKVGERFIVMDLRVSYEEDTVKGKWSAS
ncbi:hypothetical protein [Baia soyae]|uniref:Uncharacterized protein n=1 Tax=Baia soyae TaxID=1544746 RepID=A0A4R2RYB8_9BACL|nr:hypothetical protein [Baia soyae]TCP69648.1 hypothetical protein EDD57_10786 [Baia soyae]